MYTLNPRGRFARAVGLSPVVIAALASAQPVISETFDTGLNGWTTFADAINLTWESASGNPGASMQPHVVEAAVQYRSA